MAAVTNLRPAKAAAPKRDGPAPVARLGHITEKRADGREPWDPAPPVETKRRRIAWEGGKITSNKDEALVLYFSKKLARGEALTAAQRAAFAHATRGTRFEGLSEREAMALAAAEAPAREAELEPAPKKAKKRPPGKGGKRGGGRGGRGKPRSTQLTARIDSGLSVGR